MHYFARWKDDIENNIRKMGIVNWRQVVWDGADGGEQLWRCLSFLDSGTIEEEKKNKKKEKTALFYSFYHFSIKSHVVYCLLTV
jgi:hypothetical protein